MKSTLLLVTGLLLTSCSHPAPKCREVLSQSPAITTVAPSHRPTAARWATARKDRIESAISAWCDRKISEALQAEALTAEQTQQLAQYEALSNEFAKLQSQVGGMIDPATGLPVWSGPQTNRPSQQEFQAVSTRVDQARIPIAAILDRREQRAELLRHQYTPEQLVAEYVGDRFDLVVDPKGEYSNDSSILFQAGGEAIDITSGVIKLFQQKTKP